MTSLFLYGLGAIGALIALSAIPGVKHFIEPLLEFVFWLIKVGSEHLFSWLVWLAKTALNDHSTVVAHLTNTAEDLDITLALRQDEQ